MLFNSIQFLIFFPIVTLLYFLIPHKVRYIWLLVCSYYFYMCWNPTYALLILTSTILTYGCGLGMELVSGKVTEEKKQLVCAMQKQGKIVLMSGDGVNDVPEIPKDLGMIEGFDSIAKFIKQWIF